MCDISPPQYDGLDNMFDLDRKRASGSFDLLDFDDIPDMLARKRSRGLSDELGFDFFLEAADPKKAKSEEARDLMGVVHDDDALDFLLGDAEGFASTPTRAFAREPATSTPPLSPSANEEAFPLRCLPPLSLDVSCSAHLLPMPAETTSSAPLLSDDLMDLDTIPDRLGDAPADALPMPSKAWFASFHAPIAELVALCANEASNAVRVEESTLTVEQKAKHAQWFQKRKRCRPASAKAYKCPAKSRAAKNKIRTNGRFDLKPHRTRAVPSVGASSPLSARMRNTDKILETFRS